MRAFLIGIKAGNPAIGALLDAGLRELSEDPVFMTGLRTTILRDPGIEAVLTDVRRVVLHVVSRSGCDGADGQVLDFVCSLARQCFSNEYAFYMSELESSELEGVEQALLRRREPDMDARRLRVAIIACYRPLFESPCCDVAVSDAARGGFSELIVQQIAEPLCERRLSKSVARIGPIDDSVSVRVREQYEENPYPRWLTMDLVEPDSLRRVMRSALPQASLNVLPDIEGPDILIAGCGTGQEVLRRACQLPTAHVVGIDLSIASLVYATRKANELSLQNVEFMQADILQLGALGRTFDVVECIGVLHHMDDPVAGWRALLRVLKPGGVMRVGLYSEAGRRHVAVAQRLVKDWGHAATADGIRRCRRDLLAAPETAPVAQVRRIIDFYTLSEARDLLFHVQEHRFALPEVEAMIEQLGLTFIGFENSSATFLKYLERFPDDQDGTNLANWHEFERTNSDTFVGLYLFWVANHGLDQAGYH